MGSWSCHWTVMVLLHFIRCNSLVTLVNTNSTQHTDLKSLGVSSEKDSLTCLKSLSSFQGSWTFVWSLLHKYRKMCFIFLVYFLSCYLLSFTLLVNHHFYRGSAIFRDGGSKSELCCRDVPVAKSLFLLMPLVHLIFFSSYAKRADSR